MLSYCTSCYKVFNALTKTCPECNYSSLMPIKKNSPVNVIGTKIKGRIFKILEQTALLIVITESNEKIIKEYPINTLKKII